jgi:CheY-like chemotaxis protein
LRLRFKPPVGRGQRLFRERPKDAKETPEALEWIMKKILLIEDTTILRELFQMFLSKEFRVVAAATGQEALEALRGQTFDLVLSDFHLPDMTGADVYYLQGDDRPAYVALSASDSEPEFQDWVQREGIPYLTKPCPSALLMGFLREQLSKVRVCAEPALA